MRQTGVTGVYYADNRLKTVADWAYRVTTYEYYPNGLLYKTIRPNGTVQTLEYDAAGQLTRLRDVDGGGSVIVQYDYTYQDDGNVAAEQSSVEEVVPDMPDTVMTYTYDN
ncbi:MAG: RHS repeat domain-containing protein, partial [Candidatus Auribacterota bacterium]